MFHTYVYFREKLLAHFQRYVESYLKMIEFIWYLLCNVMQGSISFASFYYILDCKSLLVISLSSMTVWINENHIII